jgi:hypothetical protein
LMWHFRATPFRRLGLSQIGLSSGVVGGQFPSGRVQSWA